MSNDIIKKIRYISLHNISTPYIMSNITIRTFVFFFLQLNVEPDGGTLADNTAVCGLRVKCHGPGMLGTETEELVQMIDFGGSWSGWTGGCPSGTVVCSLLTRVQQDPGKNSWGFDIDSYSLTNAKMQCCEF